MGKPKPPKVKGSGLVAAPAPTAFNGDKYSPRFCFQFLNKHRYSLETCTSEEKVALIERLVLLSQKTWGELKQSHRHGLGYEKIDRNRLRVPIPAHIPPDAGIIAFRFQGLKAMVGYRGEDRVTLHLLFLDRDFSAYRSRIVKSKGKLTNYPLRP